MIQCSRHSPKLPCRPRFPLGFLVALLFLVGSLMGCGLFTVPQPTLTPPTSTVPTSVPPPVPTATTQPTVRPSDTPLALPSPTLPSAPILIDTFILDAPPAPGLGSGAVAIARGMIYVANWTTRNVSVISNNAVQAVIPLPNAPTAMVADPTTGRVFVLSEQEGVITVIEGQTVSTTWKVEDAPYRVALVRGALWIGSLYSGIITVLSSDDGRVLQRFALPESPAIYDLLATADGAFVYIATSMGLYRLDAMIPEITAYAPSDYHRAMALSADGHTLYAGRYDSALGQTIIEIREAATLAVTGQMPAAPDLSALLIDPRNGLLYLLSQLTGQLVTIDPATRTIIGRQVVGNEPVAMAFDTDARLLHVVNREGANVVVIHPENRSVLATVPLAPLIESLAVHLDRDMLYVALSSADRVLALQEGQVYGSWQVSPYPAELAYISPLNRLVVLSYVRGEVALLDDAGAIVARASTSARPIGLAIDTSHNRIYAGETIIDWHTGITSTWRVPGATLGSESPPQQIVVDARRDVPYAVAFNGIPGSNGGSIMARWNGQAFDTAGPMPGRFSVIEALYDDRMDRFYVTHSRMGASGLQVSDAEDSVEIVDLPLERYPVSMALNANTWHLWVALPTYGEGEPPHTLLRAYDTRSLSPAAEIEIDDRIGALAVDARRNRVYAASRYTGRIYRVQDVTLPAPLQAQAAVAPTSAAPSSAAAPSLTPTPYAPSVTPTGQPQSLACVGEADARVRSAWQSLGANAGMGCAHGPLEEGSWAAQPFERGEMLWHGAEQRILVLLDDGRYLIFEDEWREGMASESCQLAPPAERYLPMRGFGYLWCRDAEVRQALGWALAAERGLVGFYQVFAGGAILQERDGGARAFRNHGVWEKPAP